jgi:hypothetical protein
MSQKFESKRVIFYSGQDLRATNLGWRLHQQSAISDEFRKGGSTGLSIKASRLLSLHHTKNQAHNKPKHYQHQHSKDLESNNDGLGQKVGHANHCCL